MYQLLKLCSSETNRQHNLPITKYTNRIETRRKPKDLCLEIGWLIRGFRGQSCFMECVMELQKDKWMVCHRLSKVEVVGSQLGKLDGYSQCL
jgi:hypothetical protein